MTRRSRLWSPASPEGVDNPFDRISCRRADLYVTVDEIEEARARLVVAPWPSVDGTGRLRFPTGAVEGDEIPDPAESELSIDLAVLQELVDQGRVEMAQPAPYRALRVGDTFWLRGAIEEGVPRGELVDITYAARAEAKAAMAWAVTGSSAAPADLITSAAEIDDADRALLARRESQTGGRPTVPGAVASPSV
jgi:hypothetical protein